MDRSAATNFVPRQRTPTAMQKFLSMEIMEKPLKMGRPWAGFTTTNATRRVRDGEVTRHQPMRKTSLDSEKVPSASAVAENKHSAHPYQLRQ